MGNYPLLTRRLKRSRERGRWSLSVKVARVKEVNPLARRGVILISEYDK